MDLHLLDAEPTTEERDAVDALLGPPASGWDGGVRVAERDGRIAWAATSARAAAACCARAPRVQCAWGWISEGG